MKFNSVFGRIADALSTPDRTKVERAYLDKSISLADLDRRQREISRGKFRNY